jgi:hypothetical protein
MALADTVGAAMLVAVTITTPELGMATGGV